MYNKVSWSKKTIRMSGKIVHPYPQFRSQQEVTPLPSRSFHIPFIVWIELKSQKAASLWGQAVISCLLLGISRIEDTYKLNVFSRRWWSWTRQGEGWLQSGRIVKYQISTVKDMEDNEISSCGPSLGLYRVLAYKNKYWSQAIRTQLLSTG